MTFARDLLFKANEIHALTVSFPCISTGVYGFPA
jgi:O-acetyl-ADP-ribose deacetylase (regulator of RNase III)